VRTGEWARKYQAILDLELIYADRVGPLDYRVSPISARTVLFGNVNIDSIIKVRRTSELGLTSSQFR
jgi:hypothetical protein